MANTLPGNRIRKNPLDHRKLIKIRIMGNSGMQFVGQFNFSEIHRHAHNEKYRNKPENQIFLSDIGELAFGIFIRYEGDERRGWFDKLVEKITAWNALPMKNLIDRVRKEVGRDPARRPSGQYPKYWIITPPGSTVDTNGNTNKIRHVQEGRLNTKQVKLLENIGYDVLLKSNFKFVELESMFSNVKRF